MKRIAVVAVVVVLCLVSTRVHARGLRAHAGWMAHWGTMQHDHRRGGGAEVVASVGGGFGQRSRARAMWRQSAPHARILRMPGILRVSCRNGYCVGRK
jgi:hypothetical protein